MSVQGQQLDLTFFVGPFQFWIFCELLCSSQLNAAAAALCVMEWDVIPQNECWWLPVVDRREGNS